MIIAEHVTQGYVSMRIVDGHIQLAARGASRSCSALGQLPALLD